jgi:hypothetical protein
LTLSATSKTRTYRDSFLPPTPLATFNGGFFIVCNSVITKARHGLIQVSRAPDNHVMEQQPPKLTIFQVYGEPPRPDITPKEILWKLLSLIPVVEVLENNIKLLQKISERF